MASKIYELTQAKFEWAQQILRERPDITSQSLAQEAGFFSPRAFRRFLQNNFDIGIDQFRKRSLSESRYEHTFF